MVFQLDDNIISFPDPRLGEPHGLLAVGGDLSPERLELAYHYGIFPWFAFRGEQKQWFCPLERCVIFPKEVHISHSMRTLINSGRYHATFDRDFGGVIRGCSVADGRYDNEQAWLGEEIIDAFCRLHRNGLAHSVEVWDADDNLIGGFYGVIAGHCFVGDSMFSLKPSASKFGLIWLCAHLARLSDEWIIDCQIPTPHHESMGARMITYTDYLSHIHETLPDFLLQPPVNPFEN